MTDNIVSFTGITTNKINPVRILKAIAEDITEEDDVLVIVIPHDKSKPATYHMSDPDVAKAVLNLECFKFALIRDCF